MRREVGGRGSCFSLLALDVACRGAAGKGAPLRCGDSMGQRGPSKTCVPPGLALAVGCRTVNLNPCS